MIKPDTCSSSIVVLYLHGALSEYAWAPSVHELAVLSLLDEALVGGLLSILRMVLILRCREVTDAEQGHHVILSGLGWVLRLRVVSVRFVSCRVA